MNSRNKLRHPFDIKRSQICIIAIIAAVLFSLVCLLLFFSRTGDNQQNNTNALSTNKSITTSLASSVTHIDDSSVWLQRAENMLLQERKETENLKQKLETLDKERTIQ